MRGPACGDLESVYEDTVQRLIPVGVLVFPRNDVLCAGREDLHIPTELGHQAFGDHPCRHLGTSDDLLAVARSDEREPHSAPFIESPLIGPQPRSNARGRDAWSRAISPSSARRPALCLRPPIAP